MKHCNCLITTEGQESGLPYSPDMWSASNKHLLQKVNEWINVGKFFLKNLVITLLVKKSFIKLLYKPNQLMNICKCYNLKYTQELSRLLSL